MLQLRVDRKREHKIVVFHKTRFDGYVTKFDIFEKI
jgi:hypothetical protein